MAEQAQGALERIANASRANVSDVHGLGDVRRTEINDDGARRGGVVEEQMFAPGGGINCLRERGWQETEIQEARAGDFNFLAEGRDVELRDHIGGELARIEFARLGQGHQRVGLVVAEFSVARADKDGRNIGVRQHQADGLLQKEFDLFVRQHGKLFNHGWERMDTDKKSDL